jgi:hypothetical protein
MWNTGTKTKLHYIYNSTVIVSFISGKLGNKPPPGVSLPANWEKYEKGRKTEAKSVNLYTKGKITGERMRIS